MSTGSPDYWPSIYGLYELADKLDSLDGTMDGRLTLSELNGSNVVTQLEAAVSELVDTVAELVGVHSDTTAMIDYSQADTSGSAYGAWVLVSDINLKRNVLLLTITGGYTMNYSRDGGSTTAGTIASQGSAQFHSSAGIWVQCTSGWNAFTAHEEWAT